MNSISRRQFLMCTAAGAGCLLHQGLHAAGRPGRFEARYYEKLPDKKVQCKLCPWECIVGPGRRGHCDVRANENGTYYSLVYGQVAANHADPVEKKPFYHFLPGSMAYSIATAGCNVDCKFCQNADLAQRKPEDLISLPMSPATVVQQARQSGCEIIAYTYNEPVVFTEFMQDIAKLGKEQNVRSIVVSNGFYNPQPLKDLCRYIDAYKVDLKAFTESYYRDIVGGRLQPVLTTLLNLKQENVWFEIVYLMVPTLNDDTESLQAMAKWIYNELGPDVPLHFSRFYPKYKLLNLPPTPVSTLEKAYQISVDAGLHYVYLGNVPGHPGEDTKCPNCHRVVLDRTGYEIFENHVRSGKCEFCGQAIAGVWE